MNFGQYNYKYTTGIEYQKITNFLNKTNDQPSKFKTRKQVEVNRFTNNGEYNPDSQIKFNSEVKSM